MRHVLVGRNDGHHTVVIDIKDKTVPEAANTTNLPTNKYSAYQNKIVDNERVMIWDCAWSPLVPVTYQPPQRCLSGLVWSIRKLPEVRHGKLNWRKLAELVANAPSIKMLALLAE